MSLTFRKITPEDEPLVSKWLEQDEVHKAAGLKWADVVAPNTYAELVLDDDGVILEVIRYHLALRVAMQFNPDASYRVAKHSKEVVDAIKIRAKALHAKEVIIRPGGKAVHFSDKLGFVDFTGGKVMGV
jgi:hypothetical protein